MLTTDSGKGLFKSLPSNNTEGRMKIKVLRNTVASGQDLEAGKVYEVSERDAKILIQMGKAEEYKEEKEEEKGKIGRKQVV